MRESLTLCSTLHIGVNTAAQSVTDRVDIQISLDPTH